MPRLVSQLRQSLSVTRRRHSRAGRDPLVIRLELDADPVIPDPEVAIGTAVHSLGPDRLHFLRNHADIDPVTVEIAEAVEAEAILEVTEKGDIALKSDVGASSTTTAATEAATAATEATRTEATTTEAARTKATAGAR